MKKILALAAVLALTACDSDQRHPLDIEPEVITEHPVQPVIYPILQPEQPLISPQLQGVVTTLQEWTKPTRGHPQAYITLTFYIDWEGNADGYDILVDGRWEASTTKIQSYSFTREESGQVIYADIASLLPEVRVRAWRHTNDEVLSEPVNWVY